MGREENGREIEERRERRGKGGERDKNVRRGGKKDGDRQI